MKNCLANSIFFIYNYNKKKKKNINKNNKNQNTEISSLRAKHITISETLCKTSTWPWSSNYKLLWDSLSL